MSSNYQNLDTPPPTSQFRRPWSPDPLAFTGHTQASRRESSDVSLDPADYQRRVDRLSSSPVQPPSLYSQLSASAGRPVLTSPTLSRPYSLPHSPLVPQSLSHGFSPRIEDLTRSRQQDQETEVDIGNFPAFSRHWYNKDRPPMRSPPLKVKRTSHDVLSPFDPAFPTHEYLDNSVFSSQGHYSSTLLPWTNESQDRSFGFVDDDVKQERIQMLEKEFAGVGHHEDTTPVIGSVDERGMLITDGPRKRTATKVLQAVMTLGAAVCIIYASLVTKPTTAPPPRGTLPVYVLYVLSVLTFLAVVYLYFIYPNCCMGRRNKSKVGGPQGLPGGLMVLPVQQLPGGKKKRKGKKNEGGDIQVNLVVDPTMFGGKGSDDEGDEDSVGHDGKRQRVRKRMSVFEGLALEGRWEAARKLLKWMMAFDMCCLLLWGVEFFLILFGKRCPVGQFAGWCNAYNSATALTCFGFLLFGISVFFDIKDIHSSRVSPRTHT